MTSRNKLLAGAGSLVVVLLVAFSVYFFGSSADEEVNLADALDQVATQAPSSTESADATPAANTVAAPTFTADEVDGTWAVVPNDRPDEVNAGTFVGYRVTEELNNVGETEATGRTPDVDGQIVVEGGMLTQATLVANMQTLQSDRSQRDRALATRGIESSTFPTAMFTLTEAAAFDADALAAGESQTIDVVGTLELHGVVQSYTVALEVQAVGDTVVVVGSLAIALADHSIEKPVVGPVLAISDIGTLELQVFFRKA